MLLPKPTQAVSVDTGASVTRSGRESAVRATLRASREPPHLRRATPAGALTGMFVGLSAMVYIYFYTPLLWTWYVLAGAAITFVAGALVSFLSPSQVQEPRVEEAP